MSAKISIIVPVYNVERYLDKCVSSLRNQTLQDIEIILVDDGSPDNSPKMCDDYAQLDPRIKVIHKINGGLGYARNSGLEVATGEYVAFLDSDDFVHNDSYRLLYDIATSNDLDMLQFRLSRFTDEGSVRTDGDTTLTIYQERDELRQIALSYFSQSIGRLDKRYIFVDSSCCYIYKREFIAENHLRFFSERDLISEDYIFLYDCLQSVKRIGHISKELYYYRVTANSLTTTLKLENIDRCIKFAKFATERFTNDGYSKYVEFYAMGYYISRLSINADSILVSKTISKADKEIWLNNINNNEYFNYIRNNYPMERLERKYDFYLKTIAAKRYRLLTVAIIIKNKLKQILR